MDDRSVDGSPTRTSIARRRGRGAVLAAATLLVAGCSGGGTEPDGPLTVGASVEERFPYTSPEDARTFTDAFVLVDAVDERIGELEGGTDDEGYRQRWVTFEVVEVLWARDGIDKVPTRFEEAVLGLAVHDGEDARLAVDGSPYITVGEQYVLGMLTFDGALSIASTRSILPVGDGRIDVDLPEASNDRAKVAEGSDGATRLDYRAEVDGSSVMDAVELITGADPIVSDDVVDAEDRLEQWLAQSDSAPATTAAR